MSFFTRLSAIFLTITLLSGCTKVRKTLVLAEVNPPDSVVAQMDQFFANEVKRLTNGEITIEVNSSSILGDESAVINEMMTTKKIDLARISLFTLTTIGSQKAAVLTIPYLFNDRDHFWKFAKSDLASEILDEFSSRPDGLKGIFLAEEGFRHFFSTHPLKDIGDLSGRKIRTTTDPILTEIINDFGSKAIHIPFYDVLKELLVETIDTAEQPIVNYRSNFFDSAAPNVILDGHTIGVIEVVITNKAWEELTKSQQIAFLKAGENASAYCRETCEKRENIVIDSLKSTGVNIVEVKDKTPWKNACSETIRKQAIKNTYLFEHITEMAD
ncbi:TRAP transporter substrate-binding protein [Treponema sp.]|uniref:TRAP transporter substrate-binding protein n=1 Tax=Treponema sp. TaxID=166 RepID=UPI00298EB93E|nr:TRAP transporter substrate-binding protein [Treponema sp.]MCQ2240255.1 TRAP transporter substrate-binding protein [Treponema sp.]